jgi:glycosyltransferase involved in cell wall biosynthesis
MTIRNLETTQPTPFASLRVAIVQHWFVANRGGAERVVDALAELFPQADIVSPIIRRQDLSPTIKDRRLVTSFLEKFPAVHRYHRHTLFLQPMAIELFDMSKYDLVLTSDAGPAKGVLTPPGTVHICYCHTPMRYIWDMYNQYLTEMSPAVRVFFSLGAPLMRMWDFTAAARVDHFVSNSQFVAARIRKYYRRESTLIYPPVDVQRAYLSNNHQDYYLSVGRLVPYKRFDLAIQVCTQLGRPLRVIGDGPEYKSLRRMAGPTVTFLGNIADQEVRDNYAECRALIFPCEEDFGIVPVEANAHGRPVIAYGVGGALETMRGLGAMGEGDEDAPPTGLFFKEQTTASLMQAILDFESRSQEFIPERLREHAMTFDTSVFKERFVKFTLQALSENSARRLARGNSGDV